ncbi:hypothetical protein T06_7460 [Trichinella sp. T6]|nr:hypothetical protein T06_7460 [Trichinella sp. T6]
MLSTELKRKTKKEKKFDVGVRKASCCAPIYRRSRDNGERSIKASAIRPNGMEVVIMTGSLKD